MSIKVSSKRKTKKIKTHNKDVYDERFQHLIPECLQYIFSYLPVIDAIRARSVCKNWCENIDQQLSNRKYFNYNRHLQRLNTAPGKWKCRINYDVFYGCIRKLPNLKVLECHVPRTTPLFFKTLTDYCKNLEKLTIVAWNWNTSGPAMSFNDSRLIVENCPNLIYLDIQRCHPDDSTIAYIIKNLNKLKFLGHVNAMERQLCLNGDCIEIPESLKIHM